MVALIRVSSSSSPRIASCRWRGVMRFTRRSLDAFPVARRQLRHTRAQRSYAAYTARYRGVYEAETRTGKLEHLGSEILEDGRCVHSGLRAYPDVVLRSLLEVTVDTANGELWESALMVK